MGLNYEFKKAVHTIARLTPEDRQLLALRCADIRQAEDALNKKAGRLLQKCTATCNGICCRNIRLAEIIGFYDFIYLLTVNGGMRSGMAACLKHVPMFSGDCVFLKNGKGPCIFPSNARPRVCIISFCFDDTPVKREIRNVNSRFNALARFLFSRRLKTLVQFFPD